MKRSRVALAAGLAAGTACFAVAVAQPAARWPDISGVWKFKTVLERKGCTIEGEMTFKRRGPFSYSCSFIAHESCPRPDGGFFSRVQQSCTVIQIGGAVTITSTIEKVVDAGPPEYKEIVGLPGRYSPDNFSLNRISKTEMTGRFHSRNTAPVRFWREVDLTS